MHPLRQLLAGSLLGWSVGCGGSLPTSPATLPPPTPQSYVVSGTVFETVSGITRPVPGRKVDLYISGSRCVTGQREPCITEKAEVVETDQNGRYTLPVTVYPQTLVVVAGAGLHAAGRQPCLVSALVDKDTTLDVEVFPIGSSPAPPSSPGPLITGFAYETTPQGRNPVPGVGAWLQVGTGDSYPVAKTETDESGRFFFCRVNAPVQLVVSSYGAMVLAGHRGGVADIPGTGDMYFEIEVKR